MAMASSVILRRVLWVAAIIVSLCVVLMGAAWLWFERGRTQTPPPFTLSPAVVTMRLGLGRLRP